MRERRDSKLGVRGFGNLELGTSKPRLSCRSRRQHTVPAADRDSYGDWCEGLDGRWTGGGHDRPPPSSMEEQPQGSSPSTSKAVYSIYRLDSASARCNSLLGKPRPVP